MARLGGPREASRFVTDKLGVDQVFGQRCAVHDDQRTGPARRQMVKALGNQLLTSPALADNEHRPVERRSPARPLDCIEEGKALADELVCPLHAPTVGGKSHHLASIFPSISL